MRKRPPSPAASATASTRGSSAWLSGQRSGAGKLRSMRQAADSQEVAFAGMRQVAEVLSRMAKGCGKPSTRKELLRLSSGKLRTCKRLRHKRLALASHLSGGARQTGGGGSWHQRKNVLTRPVRV